MSKYGRGGKEAGQNNGRNCSCNGRLCERAAGMRQGRGGAAIMAATVAAALMMAVMVTTLRGRQAKLQVQASGGGIAGKMCMEWSALQEPYEPVEGTFCCQLVPLPCCTSQACCEAWDEEGLSNRAIPVALTQKGTAIYLRDFVPARRMEVFMRARKYMTKFWRG
eukprot:3979-Hanusia_phi.AAC.2